MALACVAFFIFATPQKPIEKPYTIENTDQKIKEVETYLDSISPSFIQDVQLLAKEEDLPSWGCGPASFSMAKILNKKFFDNKLPIHAFKTPALPLEIVQPFGLEQTGHNITDHSWLEIYINDKVLFVDPTIGQFGKINHIAYEEFNKDTDMQIVLESKYNYIRNIMLGDLIQKIIAKAPYDVNLYHGNIFSEKDLPYLRGMLEVQNSVDNGIQPAEYDHWVEFLTNKYQ